MRGNLFFLAARRRRTARLFGLERFPLLRGQDVAQRQSQAGVGFLEFGVRLEDDLHITADGAELFTPQSHSLEQPFAV